MRSLKVLLTDSLGILLIIAAPLLGWLPGPGGLPLFFAGLSLLAINHDWAQRLLDKMKSHTGKLLRRFYRKYPLADIIFWLVVILVAGYGVFSLIYTQDTERFLGFVYILVAILLVTIHDDKA